MRTPTMQETVELVEEMMQWGSKVAPIMLARLTDALPKN